MNNALVCAASPGLNILSLLLCGVLHLMVPRHGGSIRLHAHWV